MRKVIKLETALAVKNVDFYGDNLLAAQDHNGKVWAGVKWMCEGIGLTKGQMQNERKHIQSDLVLQRGERNLVLPTNGSEQSVLCLYLDYVPLWLAKISITPKMQKESPKVVEKLINYQLKAKDVLAKAFLPQYQESANISKEYKDYIDQRVDKCFVSYVEPLRNDFNHNMNMIHNAFIGVQKALPTAQTIPANTVYQTVSFGDEEWKSKQFNTIKELLKERPEYKKVNVVLRKVYAKMRNVYGIVFEQEYKDYCERHNTSGHIASIEVVSDSKQLKSLFSCILADMFKSDTITPEHRQAMTNTVIDPVRETIKPLIEKRHDISKGGNNTFRKVYSAMDVSWNMRKSRYRNAHKLKNYPSKMTVVKSNPKLLKMFCDTVNQMLEE
jgi:hypothetical protein